MRAKTHRELTRYLTGSYLKSLHAPARRWGDAQRRGLPHWSRCSGNVFSRPWLVWRAWPYRASSVWAMQMGLCEVNPVIGTVQPTTAKARDRVLSDTELAAIWNACHDDDYGRVIRLLILTGCRRQEVGGMSWDELDEDSWTIPAERTKNKRPHTLPLMPMALAIIETVPRMAHRARLFGERSAAVFVESWCLQQAPPGRP